MEPSLLCALAIAQVSLNFDDHDGFAFLFCVLLSFALSAIRFIGAGGWTSYDGPLIAFAVFVIRMVAL